MHNFAINVNITGLLPLGATAPGSFLFKDAGPRVFNVGSLSVFFLLAAARKPETRIIDQKPVASKLQLHTPYTHVHVHVHICAPVCA